MAGIRNKIKKVLYALYLTAALHVSISDGNKKLGKGIYNISLLPGDKPITLKNGMQLTNICGTCGGCCEHCKGDCYAIQSARYHHNSCIPAWGGNTVLATQDTEKYFAEIQVFLSRSWVGCFRWHVAGEIPTYEYLVKMNELARLNPATTFYFYSKRYRWLERLEQEEGFAPNLHPTVSTGWGEDYSNPCGFHEFVLDADGTADGFHCPAVDRNGNETGVTCASCKRCALSSKGMKTYCYKH